MSLFSFGQILGMFGGKHTCPQCGAQMEWENDNEETLVCPQCGNSIDSDHYGFTDEEYDSLYPSKEEVCGYKDDDEDDCGESYDEVYDELDD